MYIPSTVCAITSRAKDNRSLTGLGIVAFLVGVTTSLILSRVGVAVWAAHSCPTSIDSLPVLFSRVVMPDGKERSRKSRLAADLFPPLAVKPEHDEYYKYTNCTLACCAVCLSEEFTYPQVRSRALSQPCNQTTDRRASQFLRLTTKLSFPLCKLWPLVLL